MLPEELVGTWECEAGEICIANNGSFHSTFSETNTGIVKKWSYAGIWDADTNGLLVFAITNANAINTTNFEHIDSIEPFKIIKVDKISLWLESQRQFGITNRYIRK